MTRKGLAAKAIGAAVTCSALGGVASCLLMMMAATEPLANCAVLITLAVVSLGVSIWRALRRDLAGPRAG